MKKAVAFRRYDPGADANKEQIVQDHLIELWAKKKKVTILQTFEATSLADNVFDEQGWKELEAFVKAHAKDIDFIVTARFSTLCENDMEAAMGKAQFFDDMGIVMSIASKE
jgi:hypothetical protein